MGRCLLPRCAHTETHSKGQVGGSGWLSMAPLYSSSGLPGCFLNGERVNGPGKDAVTIKQDESKQLGEGQPDVSRTICVRCHETYLQQRTL